MLLLRTEELPEGAEWVYEIKLDGYRAIGFKTGGKVRLRSRNDNDFAIRYPSIAVALSGLPDETVIDGEVVALDAQERPPFNVLQNYGSSGAPLQFYVFDVLMLAGKNLMKLPLSERRTLLQENVLTKLAEPVRYSPQLQGALPDLVRSVKQRS
jgi:bifunctional non-homologous end joining protein LigD